MSSEKIFKTYKEWVNCCNDASTKTEIKVQDNPLGIVDQCNYCEIKKNPICGTECSFTAGQSYPNDKIKRALEILNRPYPELTNVDKVAMVKRILEE